MVLCRSKLASSHCGKSAKRRKLIDKISSDNEEEYEYRPRPSEWKEQKEDNLHYRLPIKTARGLVEQEPVQLERGTCTGVASF